MMMIIALFCLASALAQTQEQQPAQDPEVPAVVARVNGKDVTGDHYLIVWRHLRLLKMGDSEQAAEGLDQEALKHEALDRLIRIELLSQKADEMGMQADPKEVNEIITDFQNRMGGEDVLEQALNFRGVSMEEYRSDIAQSLRIEKLLQQEVYSETTVDPAEVRQYYDAHPQEFNVPEQVKARHILIFTAENDDPVKRKEALATIQGAAERIRNGEPFEDVAREVSQDRSAASGGDLGYFGRGQMVPEFEEAAFPLDKGQVSDVVETPFGYHLIKVEDKRPAGTLTFEEVEQRLADYLKHMKGDEKGEEYVENLKAQAKIERIPF
jgi:peptidyl-prolyl cis-trans isomerase C